MHMVRSFLRKRESGASYKAFDLVWVPAFAGTSGCCTAAPSRLALRFPGAVGILASDPARGLRLAVDVDRVGVLPAAGAGLLVIGAGNDGAVAAGRAAPGDGRAGAAAFKRVHFGGVSALAIFLVERRADAIADETADGG